MSLISIIVPIYKTEKFLAQCIESIINQTYKNIEVILVEDGSPDNCGEICDYYARKDQRIKVIHQENIGVSGARNAGINRAKGEFVGFVDSDDWIEPKMYEIMAKSLMSEEVQICVCTNYYRNEIVESCTNIDTTCNYINKIDSLRLLLKLEFPTSLCMSLYKSKIIRDLRLNCKIHFWEDWEFQFRVINRADKISICNKPLYYYRQRKDSATQQGLNDRILTCLNIVEEVENYEEYNLYHLDRYLKDLRSRFLISVIFAGTKSYEDNSKYYKTLKENAKICITNSIASNILNIKAKIYICLLAISPKLYFSLHKSSKKITDLVSRKKEFNINNEN